MIGGCDDMFIIYNVFPKFLNKLKRLCPKT